MFITDCDYDDLARRFGEDILPKVLQYNEHRGFSYHCSPLFAHGDWPGWFFFKTYPSPPINYPQHYQHKYLFMVPYGTNVSPTDQNVVTTERAFSNVNRQSNDLYHWSHDLVSLLIKSYQAPKVRKEVSFYAIPIERLFRLHKYHICDLLDTGESLGVYTDCIPVGAVGYNLGVLLYTFLIMTLGLCYGSQSEYTTFYNMFLYCVDMCIPGLGVKCCDFEDVFKDAAYNNTPYTFPVEETFESFVSKETRYQPRLPYLRKAWTLFVNCHENNALFKNAVREYIYEFEDIATYIYEQEGFTSLSDISTKHFLGLECLY